MNDKEFIQKLNIIKEIKPQADWKKSSRDILFSQVSNTSANKVKITIWDEMAYSLKNFFSFVTQPAVAVLSIMLVLVGGGFGVNAARNTKPGDSLYAAKELAQKAQLAVTFNKEDKARLEMRLASAHAKEITDVLSDPSFVNSENNKKKVAKLSEDFKADINIVKDRIQEISKIRENKISAEKDVKNGAAEAVSEDDVAVGIGNLSKDGEAKVFSAESSKDNKGVEVYDKNAAKENPAANLAAGLPAPAAASSTEAAGEDAVVSIGKTLDAAQQSFATNDFAGAKTILEKVNQIIDNINKEEPGAVKGASEIGTTTAGSVPSGTSTPAVK